MPETGQIAGKYKLFFIKKIEDEGLNAE